MARARSPNSIEAEEMYKNGMKLVDIAKKLDVPDSTVRRWKSTQNWDGKTKGKKNERSQKKKTNARHKGGQPGNRNAVGNKGGPLKPGDKIAEKHGAYSSVYWDVLDEAEKDMIEDIPMDEEMLLIEQIQLFAVRERRIMIAINKYRSMKGEVSLYGFNRSESKRTFKTEEDKQLYEERIEKKVSAEERLPGDMYNMQTTSGVLTIDIGCDVARFGDDRTCITFKVNEVVQIEFIRNTPSIMKTEPLEPYVPFTYYHHGTSLVRQRKFRKYRQDIGGKTVYYKEFGDPRIMDRRNGKYLEAGETLDRKWQANEILEFAIGTKPYGEIRWIGQLLGVDGSRRAESLNNNYFINGRHTPLLIMIKGGTLTEDSYTKLQEYMNGIKGEQGQHAFIVLEAENAEQRTDFDTSDKPEIEIKDIASILQKDELFQEYLENNRKRVQSAFLLPDLYVGYTTDFNRATAQTAKEVTEEQVFQPERISLAWVINNKLLNGYQFKHVEAYFLAPNITNPDDLYKILTVSNNAGGLTPNKAKDVVYRMLGETSEDYEEEWGDIPLKIYAERNSSVADVNGIAAQLTQQIQKAQSNNAPDEVVSVMKSVQKLLKEIKEQEGKQ